MSLNRNFVWVFIGLVLITTTTPSYAEIPSEKGPHHRPLINVEIVDARPKAVLPRIFLGPPIFHFPPLLKAPPVPQLPLLKGFHPRSPPIMFRFPPRAPSTPSSPPIMFRFPPRAPPRPRSLTIFRFPPRAPSTPPSPPTIFRFPLLKCPPIGTPTPKGTVNLTLCQPVDGRPPFIVEDVDARPTRVLPPRIYKPPPFVGIP